MSHRHHHHAHSANDFDDAADILDLEAGVLADFLSTATARLRDAAGDRPVRRILDLACGTGGGALALAERFPEAEVTGADQSEPLLDRLRGNAEKAGHPIRTVQADLDGSWPDLGALDVIWISMALHHLADPDAALRRIASLLTPGGLLAVVEAPSPLRVLPETAGADADRPGLEARCHAALAEMLAGELPFLGADWGEHLTRSGYTVEDEVTRDVDLVPPLAEGPRRFARESLLRLRGRLEDTLPAEDLAALDAIAADDGADLHIHGSRTLWVARRST
jgi:ubiquinone/menaquinone biosynthesis C-methylase UbiE